MSLSREGLGARWSTRPDLWCFTRTRDEITDVLDEEIDCALDSKSMLRHQMLLFCQRSRAPLPQKHSAGKTQL
jgi:hypothetical protein